MWWRSNDSRHCLSADEAADLIKQVPVFTKSVAVISPGDVDEAVQAGQSRPGQMSCRCTAPYRPEDLAELKSRVPQKMMAAVAAAAGSKEARRYAAMWPMPFCWTRWSTESWAEREPFMIGIRAPR